MKPIKGFSKPGEAIQQKKKAGIGAWIVHKSSQLIAFNKPSALAVQTAKEDAPSLQKLACAYAKRDLYLIHRIDQPASGLVLFARHKKTVQALQQQFHSQRVKRTYLVVVEGLPTVEEGELRHILARDGRTNKSQVVEPNTPEAKEALLTWKQIGTTDRFPILEVELKTGRHHQIRAQLAAVGAPIHGDVKYGARRANANRSIHLHAWKLEFDHPISNERMSLTAELPKEDVIWEAVQEVLAS